MNLLSAYLDPRENFGGDVLLCPDCGYDYVHLIDPCTPEALRYRCEGCGAETTLVIEEHKGQVILRLEP